MSSRLERLADLLVNFGANVQEGQILDVGSGLGKEEPLDSERPVTASIPGLVEIGSWLTVREGDT